MNENNANIINDSDNVLSVDNIVENIEQDNTVQEPSSIQLQAQAPYYYDYYGEKTLEDYQTIIQNQETIIQNGYVISFLLAIILIISVLRNMLVRR